MEQVNLTSALTISEIDTVVVSADTAVTIVTGLMGPMGPKGADAYVPTLASIPDVDTVNKQNGSILVYSTITNTWVATNTLNNQTIEAGQY